MMAWVPSLLPGLLALSLQAPTPTPAQHHERAPNDPFRLQALAGGVHALYGEGGNVGFLVGPDAVLVVDSQYLRMAPGIVKKIATVTDKPIKYLVNTHHHGDHVGGNATFRPIAVILAHHNVRRRMLASPQDILRDFPQRVADARKAGDEARAKSMEEQIEWAKKVTVEEIPAPVLTFESEVRVHLGPPIPTGTRSSTSRRPMCSTWATSSSTSSSRSSTWAAAARRAATWPPWTR
jgi:hypothetical protein